MSHDEAQRDELTARVRALYDRDFHCLIEVRADEEWEPRLLAMRSAPVADVVEQADELLLLRGEPAVRISGCDARTLRAVGAPAPFVYAGDGAGSRRLRRKWSTLH